MDGWVKTSERWPTDGDLVWVSYCEGSCPTLMRRSGAYYVLPAGGGPIGILNFEYWHQMIRPKPPGSPVETKNTLFDQIASVKDSQKDIKERLDVVEKRLDSLLRWHQWWRSEP